MTTKTPRYRISNWKEYNQNLKKRGSIEVWIDKEVEKTWKGGQIKGRGKQQKYSDKAIEVCITIGKVFHQRLRQTEGLMKSLVKLMEMEVKVPDYTTLSRRGKKINVKLEKKNKEKIIMIVDSTGIKVYGEGEWKIRQYGHSKRRTWRKIHIAIDGDGEIRGIEFGKGGWGGDSVKAEKMIREETTKIEAVYGDGAYDSGKIYRLGIEKGVQKVLIPPREESKIWKHGNQKGPPHPRDENLRIIRKRGKKKWKEISGYHKRSLVENGMYRIKTVFGGRLNAKLLENQRTEVMIMGNILNRMTHLGMPNTYKVI